MDIGPLAERIGTYMDLLAARQRVTASNIANVDTPDYRTKDIDFQFEFQAAVRGEPTRPEEAEVQGLIVKNDGNDVSLDREARLLAENAIRFNVASNFMRSKIRGIRNAIQEGKGGE